MSKKNFEKKLFLLFALMGAIPMLIVIVYGGANMTAELERNAMTNSWYRNTIIDGHLSELAQKNLYVLRALAATPYLRQYVAAPSPEGEQAVRQLLQQANSLFQDNNLMAVTNSSGQQLIRSDGTPLVNIAKRQHFQETMQGRVYVSDLIQSMSTGDFIIVLAVPIFDGNGQPIGLLQRNFNLNTLQDFVERQADEFTTVIIIDHDGKIIAHSDWNILSAEERTQAKAYRPISAALGGAYGISRIKVKGDDCIVSYSRNVSTGWGIATIYPYHYIWGQSNKELVKRIILGLVVLLLMSIASYLLANRLTRPIRAIADMALRIANGQQSLDALQTYSDDEIGQVARSLDTIHATRQALQIEAECDPLTQVANRTAIESFCRRKLVEYSETANPGLMALYLIDLDHFNELNNAYGHQYGDRILIEFAKRLKSIFRPTDCVGRFGGDEFIVIIDKMPDVAMIEKKAEAINDIARGLVIGDKIGEHTASIGIAIAPRHGKTYNHLLQAADLALYHAKRHGGNNYHIATDTDEKRSHLDIKKENSPK